MQKKEKLFRQLNSPAEKKTLLQIMKKKGFKAFSLKCGGAVCLTDLTTYLMNTSDSPPFTTLSLLCYSFWFHFSSVL